MQLKIDTSGRVIIHELETAQTDDVHGLKTLFQSQQFANLLKNGDVASWSQGDSAAPDGWAGNYVTFAKNNDGTIGSNYATITTDGSGNDANFYQVNNNSSLLSDWLSIVKALNLSVTIRAKVRSTSNKVYLRFSGDVGGLKDYHSGSGDWEDLELTYNYTGTETALGIVVEVADSDNTSAITFDVGQTILVIGELPVAFANHPNDQHLKAVDYQDSAGTNYEYGLIVEQNGIAQIDDTASTKAITFPKEFTKLLGIQITPIDDVEVIRAASGSATGFIATRSGTAGNNQFYWSAKGIL